MRERSDHKTIWLSTRFFEHPDIVAVGGNAAWQYGRTLSQAKKRRTPGTVPLDWFTQYDPDGTHLTALVDVGLLRVDCDRVAVIGWPSRPGLFSAKRPPG